MKEKKDFVQLKLDRSNKKISRENYWIYIQNFLETLSEFSKLQNLYNNKISIQDDRITINIKCTKTHDAWIRMVLDPTDVRSAPFCILADGFYEPFQADLLLDLGSKSNTFLDIGANMGFYSLALLAVNRGLRVTAFEPQPNVAGYLKENIELNSVSDRIEVFNIGLGQQEDSLTLYVPVFTGSGGGSFADQHPQEGHPTQVKVPVKLLDNLITTKVDLIKMDVEGFELNVLLGSTEIIARDKPTIMVELLRKWMKPFGHSPQLFLETMFRENYYCYAICANSLIKIDQISEKTEETNFIFVHANNVQHLDTVSKYVFD